MNNLKNDDEIVIMFVIENRYIRWEGFPLEASIKDVFKLLETKYKAIQCCIEMNTIFYSKRSREKLMDICFDKSGCMYVYVKDENYTLDKNIK